MCHVYRVKGLYAYQAQVIGRKLRRLNHNCSAFSRRATLASRVLLGHERFRTQSFSSRVSANGRSAVNGLASFFGILRAQAILGLYGGVGVFTTILIGRFARVLSVFLCKSREYYGRVRIIFSAGRRIFLVLLARGYVVRSLIQGVRTLFVQRLTSSGGLASNVQYFRLFCFRGGRAVISRSVVSRLRVISRVLMNCKGSLLVSRGVVHYRYGYVSVFWYSLSIFRNFSPMLQSFNVRRSHG